MINAKQRLLEGQGTFCDIIKMALYQEDDTIFERLDFEDDRLYLEPILFSYCSKKAPHLSRAQILFGTFAPEHRPDTFSVHTNKQGWVYLPAYGYLKTDQLSEQLTLSYEAATQQITLSKDGIPIAHQYQPLQHLEHLPDVELTGIVDVYSEQLFYGWTNVKDEVVEALLTEQQIAVEDFQPAIEQAFDWLQTYFPEEFDLYGLTTRKIVLFSEPQLRNFASREMHGTIYLNVSEHSNATFFFEELIHQCSHTVFNAMTSDAKSLFQIDQNTTIGTLLHNSDYRTLYGALHGIYTTGKIVDLFIKLLQANPDVPPRIRHELQGRVAINKNRHNIGLEQVDLEAVFTPEGLALFQHYYQQLDENMKQHTAFFEYDMAEHPVVFSYEKFQLDNPLEAS